MYISGISQTYPDFSGQKSVQEKIAVVIAGDFQ